ncbi:MAG: hypothetical protein WBV69_14335 [Candidatus Sulfotelmatobacter sp.]
MTAKFTMCPNTAASVHVKTVMTFDVFEIGQYEIGQEVGRIWTESAVDVNPRRWQFSQVKGGVNIGEPSEYFDTKEDALAAFERNFEA